ncbi:acyl-coenzyme A thioesterase PaaI-like protein [Thermocatellispora tengchongensis]|uniref:Acyl-coenzyme A thioesterase THEM4 n=1 Tax=Thermocatellispora tengchongensis TaxID=1073253 RepID=A0A840P5U4_9ACTN|nr:PaaI family thioesterase [Thermocatellispora tengchongensis]MBB5133273.1 acyl-coenzyme A thioesterase PaaI-like protein [Thermocatellispora tengchongensis]
MTFDLAFTEDADAESRLEALAALTRQTRELMDAVALTAAPEGELAEIAGELAVLTERLRAVSRQSTHPFHIGSDGTLRHVGNAVIGSGNPFALPLVIEPDPSTGEGGVRADVTFRPIHEGPPGSVHGGVSALIMDHLLGHAAALAGRGGFTGTLTLRYVRRVPYGEPLAATAAVARTEGRKTWVEGRIADQAGTVLVEATGLFITPTQWPPMRDAPSVAG